ncbi:MAG TPA: hypothetical protein VKT17_07955 [Acidobacteriota bacterium]|nr:hypothetical protein [Acidobacteriota bacterium]
MTRLGRWAAGKIILMAGLLFFPALPSSGQAPPFRNISGLTAGGLFPTGPFNDHVSQEGVGLGGFYARRLGSSPLLVGADLSFADYGHTSWVAYLLGVPEIGVDTKNSIIQGLALLRIQPRTGRVKTFVEGLAGISYLYTATAVGTLDDGSTDWETNHHDWTWTAGAGAGLSILLGKSWAADPGESPRRTFFELKVRYLAGGQADYLKKGSLVFDGSDYVLTPDRSATSVITVQAGFSVVF